MKVIFMGTPEFAVGSLEALYEAGHEVVLVVTQPDKEKGRGKQVAFTPVKECAIAHNTPVFQPVKIREEESVAELKKYAADIFVVAAFGQILSKEILEMPRYGCVNVHASLLPKYRGAAPIQRVIIDGESESGVTIMQMNEGLDTGDMISKVVVPIESNETGDSLHDKLSVAGAKLLVETLTSIENGTATRTVQDESLTCYAKMLSKNTGYIDFGKSAVELDRLIRGLNSWPSAFTKRNGKVLKIWEADVISESETCDKFQYEDAPGTIRNITKETFDVITGRGALRVRSLQLEGKKRMSSADFLRGNKVTEGEVLPS